MKLCKLSFIIVGAVNKEERPVLMGGCSQLGKWDHENSLPFLYDDSTNCWISETTIHVEKNTMIEFKIGFMNLGGDFLRWEDFEGNRSYRVFWHSVELSLQVDLNEPPFQVILQNYIDSPYRQSKERIRMSNESFKFMREVSYNHECNIKMEKKPNYSFDVNIHNSVIMTKPIQPAMITERVNAVIFSDSITEGFDNSDEEDLNASSEILRNDKPVHNFMDGEKMEIMIGDSSRKNSQTALFESNSVHSATNYMREPNLIVVTAMLPIQFTKGADGEFSVIDSFIGNGQMFYYIRKFLQKRHKFIWVGCLVFEDSYEEKNRLKSFLLEKHSMLPVFLTKSEFESAHTKVFQEYFNRIFSVSSLDQIKEFTEESLYDIEKDWSIFEAVNKRMADRISEHLQNKPSNDNKYVVIFDLMCILIPQYFLQRKFKICSSFYFHSVFPHLNHFRKSPKFKRIFMSMYACDIIFFNSNQQAYNFIRSSKDLFMIDAEYDKSASIILTYKGRRIFVSILSLGVEKSMVTTTKNMEKKLIFQKQLTQVLNGRKFIFAREQEDFKVVILKLNLFEHLIRMKPDLRDKIYFTFCVTCTLTRDQKDIILEKSRLINEISGTVVIDIIIQEFLEKYKRVVFLQKTDILFDVAYQERLSLFTLEYKITRKEYGKMMLDDQASSVDALNHNVHRVNPMRIVKFCEEFCSLIYEVINSDKENVSERSLKLHSDNKLPLIDPESNPLYSIEIWFENLLCDLKQAAMNQRTVMVDFHLKGRQNYEILATHKGYDQMAFKQIYKDLKDRSGILILDFDALFFNHDKIRSLLHYKSNKKEIMNVFTVIHSIIHYQLERFLSMIDALSKSNPNVIIILFSIREKKLFNLLFENMVLPNVYLMVQCGSNFKRLDKKNNNYSCAMTSSGSTLPEFWIDSVRICIENYTARYNLFSFRFHKNFIELSVIQRECELTKGRRD